MQTYIVKRLWGGDVEARTHFSGRFRICQRGESEQLIISVNNKIENKTQGIIFTSISTRSSLAFG